MAVIPPVTRVQTAAAALDGVRVAGGHADATRVASSAKAAKTGEAFRQFEAFVLQSFIETMLPKNAEAVFGKGSAGAIWKSMLAEKMADQISRHGGIGIAQRIAAGPNAEVLPTGVEAEASAPRQTQTSAPLLRTPEQHGDDA